tara:strand:+ start:580 stop:1104 length:525 start_codon:yes stop_codon:yes gene_type:complete
MYKLNILLTLILFNSFFHLLTTKSFAGINKSDEIMKWRKINDNSFIDTKEFSLKNNFLELNIKNKGYKKIKLVIDCKNLTYKKIADNKKSLEKPIQLKSIEYKIASEVCFLTGTKGFYKEIRPVSWARVIINRFQQNPSKFITYPISSKKETPLVIKNETNMNLNKSLSSSEDN